MRKQNLYGMTFTRADGDDTAGVLIRAAQEGYPDLYPTGSAIISDTSVMEEQTRQEEMDMYLERCSIMAIFWDMEKELEGTGHAG